MAEFTVILLALNALTFSMFVIALILSIAVRTMSVGSKKVMWWMIMFACTLLAFSKFISLISSLGYVDGLYYQVLERTAALLAGITLVVFFRETSSVL